MGAIAISESISIKFGILIFRPNLVVCAKFTVRADITRLVHNKRQIGRRYIWEGSSLGQTNVVCKISSQSDNKCDLHFVHKNTWTDGRTDGQTD